MILVAYVPTDLLVFLATLLVEDQKENHATCMDVATERVDVIVMTVMSAWNVKLSAEVSLQA